MAESTNWSSIGVEFDERRKLPALVRDLGTFGIQGDQLDEIPLATVATFTNESEAYGAMAVVEGSTAGATATAKKLATSNLAIGPDNGAAFFNNYGDRQIEMRHSFAQAVLGQTVNEADFLAGGRKTFDLYYEWLSTMPA